MGNLCKGGQFDGYALTTDRDIQLCQEGGGSLTPDGRPTSGGCSGETVSNFSAAAGQPIDTDPLRNAQSVYRGSREVRVLRELSTAALPVVQSVLAHDPRLAAKFPAALKRLTALAAAALGSGSREEVYSAEDHRYFSDLAGEVARRGESPQLSKLVEAAVQLAHPFQGMTSREIRERLGPVPELSDAPVSDVKYDIVLPPNRLEAEIDIIAGRRSHSELFSSAKDFVVGIVETYGGVVSLRAAEAAISEKARSLGALAAIQQSDVGRAGDGYVQEFADCNIYYSAGTGAHEVHGDIRRKYVAINGPALLGLPTTDETACPDSIGRFNHFAKSASIYWTPTTGPFYLKGAVRFRWASSGWEVGEFGYPVRDEATLPGLYPGDNPDMHWSSFQNGMIFGQGPAAARAELATATRQQIQDAIRTAFDRKLTSKSYKVGLISFSVRPGLYGVDFLGIDDWAYGFWGSAPRTLRLRIRGFVSVPIAPDPTFEIDVGLQFSTVWPTGSFFFPASKTVIARLVSSQIRVSGILAGDIATEIKKALTEAFTPGLDHPEVQGAAMFLAEVPTGANQRGSGNLDFLDVMLSADGSLHVFVNPLPAAAGFIRRLVAQTALNNALENL